MCRNGNAHRAARLVCTAVVAAVICAALSAAGALAQSAGQKAKTTRAPPAKSSTVTGSLAVPSPGAESDVPEGQPKDPRLFYYRQLALIHGQLFVGNELVQEERWEEALPHFQRPLEVSYPQLVPYLRKQSIASFDTQLKALAQSVKSRNKEAYDAARLFVQMRLERALDGARRFMVPMQSYTLKTLVEVLKAAQSEYGAAVQDGQIAEAGAYQNGRGFIYYAHQMFESIAPDLETADRKSVDDMRWAFVELKTAWPTPMPPGKAAMTTEAVAARVTRIAELAAGLQ